MKYKKSSKGRLKILKIIINDNILSDDSRAIKQELTKYIKEKSTTFASNAESPSHIFFVQMALNKHFVDEVKCMQVEYAKMGVEIGIITPLELKKYLLHTPKIIGITGTNGKTTTASCIYSIFLSLGIKVAMIGTRGFFVNGTQISPKGLTTPTLLELYYDIHLASLANCEFVVMEVSSHAIAQERIEGIEFALKILTNITSDHLDFHKSIDEYERVKNSFFATSGAKLVNKDAKNARFNIENSYTYGIDNRGNLSPSVYSIKDSIHGHIIWNDFRKKLSEESLFHSHLCGKHNLYNILAAISAIKILLPNLPLGQITQALEEFGGVEGRMEIVHQKPLVIVDFAHTPDGMKNIFESFLGEVSIGKKPKVLFGAGGNRDKSKRPVMGHIAERYAKQIYLTSDNPRNENPDEIINDILSGINDKSKVIVESNRKIAIESALSQLDENDILLILGKGDEIYQIIGDKKLEFDDRIEVKRYYENLGCK